MARKGWENLSESYRKRLGKAGISKSAYDSGASLQKARGHVSVSREGFNKRTTRFVHRFGDASVDPHEQLERIRNLGAQKGQQYMDYRREMTRLYMSGRAEEASRMYKERPKHLKLLDADWHYHSIFGG